MPGFVTGLVEAPVTTAYIMGDDLGDSDSIILGVDFPDDTAMTAIASVDHTMGTIGKDGFLIGELVEAVRDRYPKFIPAVDVALDWATWRQAPPGGSADRCPQTEQVEEPVVRRRTAAAASTRAGEAPQTEPSAMVRKKPAATSISSGE